MKTILLRDRDRQVLVDEIAEVVAAITVAVVGLLMLSLGQRPHAIDGRHLGLTLDRRYKVPIVESAPFGVVGSGLGAEEMNPVGRSSDGHIREDGVVEIVGQLVVQKTVEIGIAARRT
jgi:hypothetical protein